jgi:hypothetical protein
VRALAAQAIRHAVPVELILVEWNPPPERPLLRRDLKIREAPPFFTCRVITVPPDAHSRYQHAKSLPLYQMIAKNVGIRRASGEFILGTNIDLVFSDELMQFLSSRILDDRHMYRIDRTDVDSGVPIDSPVADQLEYCRQHRIRVNAREGTFGLSADGFRLPAPIDILERDAGLYLDQGWYPPEQHYGKVFRWVSPEAAVRVRPESFPRSLLLDVICPRTTKLQVGGEMLTLHGHVMLRIPVPAGMDEMRLAASEEVARLLPDGRLTAYRVLSCRLDLGAYSGRISVAAGRDYSFRRTLQTAYRGARLLNQIRRGEGPPRMALPVPSRVLDRLDVRREPAAGVSVAISRSAQNTPVTTAAMPAPLHTNACGDFTLLHRRHWFDLRGYPEFDLYSMNIDALFCYMAHYAGAAEYILQEPMRIYHIEHASGSGWTPEGQRLLFERLAAKGIPWLEFKEVLAWAAQMERLQTTMIFNHEDWGLGSLDLAESAPGVE